MTSAEQISDTLTFVKVSDIGANHKLLSLPNQDYADFKYVDDDFVLAVSDGVGSCKFADIGAQTAVKVCLELFKKIKANKLLFENEILAENIIKLWKNSIEDGCYNSYCATIKAAFKIGNILKLVSLGDGFVGISSNGINMISPKEDSCFTNETQCLRDNISPDKIWIRDFSLDTYMPYTIFCCTDGVANSIEQGKELALIEEIEKNTDIANTKSELEAFITEIGNYSLDDKTVGVVKYAGKN